MITVYELELQAPYLIKYGDVTKKEKTTKIKKFLIEFVIAFTAIFVANAIAIYVWNLIRYGEGAFNWEITFPLAIGVGIALALIHALESKE